MFDIDFIIPCYGKSELISRGLSSLVTQWHKEYIHVTLVNDCSPNTDCDYQDLVDKFKDEIDIRCIRTPKNGGQGLARQYGIDNTTHDYFMFMDEDDQIGNGIAISIFVGAVEGANIMYDENHEPIVKDGKIVEKEDKKPVALVSGPLFEWDDNHTHVIDNTNRVWVNSKLYSRAFINKHNIRFNEAQSRHAEDYFFMSCFFYAMDNDPEYTGILLDNTGIYYLWYPNEESQSRVDPHYPYMLSGYTMNGSVNILKYMKDSDTNKIPWTEETHAQYRAKLLNMNMYAFFTFLSFIRHVATTDYVPKLELDWTILRDSCNELRELLNEEGVTSWTSTERIEEYYRAKNMSDVLFTEPWMTFDDYFLDGCEELSWSFDDLLKSKETMKFDEKGELIWGD